MRRKATAKVGAPHHIIDVVVADDSIVVTPDYIHIHAGESVQWRFRGVGDAKRPEIRFINPAVRRFGPFRNFSLGCCPDPEATNGARIYTITGLSADTRRCIYEYEAGVTIDATGTWVGMDPIIENDGGPPGTP